MSWQDFLLSYDIIIITVGKAYILYKSDYINELQFSIYTISKISDS